MCSSRRPRARIVRAQGHAAGDRSVPVVRVNDAADLDGIRWEPRPARPHRVEFDVATDRHGTGPPPLSLTVRAAAPTVVMTSSTTMANRFISRSLPREKPRTRRAFSSIGRRDLNSGPLVPQTAPAVGRGLFPSGLNWPNCLQIVRSGVGAPLSSTDPLRGVWAANRQPCSRDRQRELGRGVNGDQGPNSGRLESPVGPYEPRR